jgi:hypothetical protein
MATRAITAAHFTVAYDGPGVVDATMDVRELAPALLSLGALCERTNELVNGERSQVSVRVQAGANRGSFPVDIQLVQLADIAGALFDQVRDANELLKLIGVGGVVGLFQLIKKLRGKKPDKVEDTPQGTQVTSGDTTIIVDKRVVNLYLDPEARRHARGVVRPLRAPAIDVVKFRSGETQEEEITEEEIDYFEVEPAEPAGQELIPPTTATFAFEIVKAPLTEGGRIWHLRNDTMNIQGAAMEDEVFQARMNAREEKFAVGDILIVRIRTETTQDANGKIHNKHFIVEVLDHSSPPPHPILDFRDSP